MVMLSQEIISKHKNDIISGTYVVESKLHQLKLNANTLLCEPECIIVKEEQQADADIPTNTTLRKRLKSLRHFQNEEETFPEITDNNDDDSDNSDYFLADLKDNIKTSTNNGNNNISNYLIEHIKSDDDLSTQYQCSKCNAILESSDIKEHSCDAYNCYKDDDIEVTLEETKEDGILKGKRGRPKKKLKSPKPEIDYQCYHCSMIFNKRWKLQKHITRVHSDSKKYVCTYCNKGFKQSYHLREHLTSHTGERNYTCSFCDKSFQRISSMRRHIRSHEAAPGQKTKRTPFLCTVCGKSFPFSNGVQRHMRIHLGIKNHECTICHRRFTQSTHLHVHMRTHTGEKPYICDTCGDAFSLNASLQKHMLIHQSLADKAVLCKKLSLDNL